MSLDTKYLQFILECIGGEKPPEVMEVTRLEITRMLKNGQPPKDKEILREILPYMDDKRDRRGSTKEIKTKLNDIIRNQKGIETKKVQERYTSIGYGSSNLT